MQSNIEEVREILKNYHFIEMQIKSGIDKDKIQEKLAFLVDCIKNLPENLYIIIVGLYLEKHKIADITRRLYISKKTVYRHRDKAIEQLAKLYNLRFGKDDTL